MSFSAAKVEDLTSTRTVKLKHLVCSFPDWAAEVKSIAENQ
jgi:hypothetical protein